MNEKTQTKREMRLQATTNALASLVRDRFTVAANTRASSGMTELMLICRRAELGQPLTGKYADPDFPVVYDITNPITRGITALLNDTLSASAADLFVLKPTSAPELTQAAQSSIVARLGRQQDLAAALGMPLEEDEVQRQASRLIQAAEVAGRDQATRAAQALEGRVRDMLEEGDFDHELRAGMHDLVHGLTMVLKCPSMVTRKVKVWDEQTGTLRFTEKLVRGVERIDPLNIYPAPNATDAQSADYIVEVRTVSPNDLIALAQSDGYSRSGIMDVLKQFPLGHAEHLSDSVATLIKTPEQDMVVTSAASTPYTYDALVMYGRVKGDILAEMGVDGVDGAMLYDAEVVTIGDIVVRAVLNSDAMGRRPYYTTSYDPVGGSFWGRCPVAQLIPVQRAATSVFTAMLGDMSLAGIHIEVNPSRLSDDDELTSNAVRPRVVRIRKGTASGSAESAYYFNNISPNSAQYRAELAALTDRAFDIVGVQRFAIGETTNVGTIGRTSGGLAQLLNQAGKTLKQVMRHIERGVIEPIVQHYVDYELEWGDTSAILQGDVNVQAKGLSSLAETSDKAKDLEWALQSISAIAGKANPQTGKPYVPDGAVPMLLYQMFKARGLPTAGIFDQDMEASAVLSPDSSSQIPANESGAQLDGRSQTAMDSINSANNVAGANPTPMEGAAPTMAV